VRIGGCSFVAKEINSVTGKEFIWRKSFSDQEFKLMGEIRDNNPEIFKLYRYIKAIHAVYTR
jgi:hypothetical protein